MPLHK